MKQFQAALFLIVAVGLQSCYKEEVIFDSHINEKLELTTILSINGKECTFDNASKSLRFPLKNDEINEFSPLIEFQDYSVVYFEGLQLKNGVVNNLGKVKINHPYQVTVETSGKKQSLILSFTNISTVQIITPNTIYDEPKTLAKIIVNYPEVNRRSDQFFIGLEYRGGSSQVYSKKSFGFALKNNASLNNNISSTLFDMKSANEWILDAMWIDKARLRNKTSFEIWKKMDSAQHFGIASRFVELYINNEHQGLYCLNENINAEFLNLSGTGASLYKAVEWENGATRFEAYSGITSKSDYWDGWEQNYPNPKLSINWKPLVSLRQLVVNGDDDLFASEVPELIDLDNFIDYYIFLNLNLAYDNTGKNTFLLRRPADQKFTIIPWDLDGSFGIFWNGNRIGYEAILSNNLFDRLLQGNIDNFKGKLKQRWIELRGTALINEELKAAYTKNFKSIRNSGIIEIENSKWGSNIDINSEEFYLLDWVEKRLMILDNYYANL